MVAARSVPFSCDAASFDAVSTDPSCHILQTKMNRFLPFLGLMPITLLLFLVSFAEAIPGVGRVHHGQHHGHEHIRRAVDKSTKFVVQTVHTTVWGKFHLPLFAFGHFTSLGRILSNSTKCLLVALATSSDVIGSTPLVSSEAPVVLLSSTSADGSVFPKPFGTITAAAEPDEIDVPPSMDANAILGSQLDSVNAAQAQTASEEIESDLDGAEGMSSKPVQASVAARETPIYERSELEITIPSLPRTCLTVLFLKMWLLSKRTRHLRQWVCEQNLDCFSGMIV